MLNALNQSARNERRYLTLRSLITHEIGTLENLLAQLSGTILEEIPVLVDSVKKNLKKLFLSLVSFWKQGDLSPGSFNVMYRRVATLLFADANLIEKYNELLGYSSVVNYDIRLYTKIKAGIVNDLITDSLDLNQISSYGTVFPSEGLSFKEHSLMKDSILGCTVFWYATSDCKREPEALLALKKLATKSPENNLVEELKALLKKNYFERIEPVLKKIFLWLISLPKISGSPFISINAVEGILAIYDGRCKSLNVSFNLSPAEFFYLKIILEKKFLPPSRGFFVADPKPIQCLRQFCRKVRDFRGEIEKNFFLNLVEQELLLSSVRDQNLNIKVAPNPEMACYCLLLYFLARAFNQDPLYLLGYQQGPGCFNDAAQTPLHSVRYHPHQFDIVSDHFLRRIASCEF